MRHRGQGREEAVVDRFGRQRIEHLAQLGLVGRADGAQKGERAVGQLESPLQAIGVDRHRELWLDLVGVDEVTGLRLGQEPWAEARIRDLDEGRRPLAHGLAVQVGDAVLRHHVVDVAAAGHDAGPRLQGRNDPRDGPVFRRRRQRDDGLAALRTRRPADEVDLTADAAVEQRSERVGTDLPGEIHLDGRVDRGHPVVLRDHERIVRVLGRVELDHRVVVDEVVQRL